MCADAADPAALAHRANKYFAIQSSSGILFASKACKKVSLLDIDGISPFPPQPKADEPAEGIVAPG
jgi:hypothetical protein